MAAVPAFWKRLMSEARSTCPSGPLETIGPREVDRRLLGPGYRAATLAIVGLVSLVAYEAIGNATVMPQAAAELNGVSLYGFAFGAPLAASIVGMVASGRWADEHSPLRPVWAGGACFIAGLVLAAASPSMNWLLAGRLVTGLGSGMLAVALYAMVGRIYPGGLHSRIFAAFSAAWVLPSLIAPALSGGVAQAFGWRWAMVLVAALTVPVLALLVPIRLAAADAGRPATPAPKTRRLTWAVVAAGGALVMHVVGQGEAHGGGNLAIPTRLAALLLAAAAVALAVSAYRLLPAGTLRAKPGLPAAVALSGLSQGAFFAAEAFLPLLLHRQRGMPLGLAGLALTAGALSWSIGAMYRARMHGRVTATWLLRGGLWMLGTGIAVSMLAIAPGVPVWTALLGWAIAGGGMGLISPTLSILTLAMAQPGSHGHAGASLRLSAAMTTTGALALSGSAFAALLDWSASAAFAVCLGIAALLAAGGACLAGRVEAPIACR